MLLWVNQLVHIKYTPLGWTKCLKRPTFSKLNPVLKILKTKKWVYGSTRCQLHPLSSCIFAFPSVTLYTITISSRIGLVCLLENYSSLYNLSKKNYSSLYLLIYLIRYQTNNQTWLACLVQFRVGTKTKFNSFKMWMFSLVLVVYPS